MKKQVNCQFQKAYEEEENLIRNFKKLMKKKNKSMCRQHQVKQSCVSILNNTQIQGRPTLLVRGLSDIFDIKIAIIACVVSPLLLSSCKDVSGVGRYACHSTSCSSTRERTTLSSLAAWHVPIVTELFRYLVIVVLVGKFMKLMQSSEFVIVFILCRC